MNHMDKAIERALNGDPNIRDKSGRTALMRATGAGRRKDVELLLDRGANPNIVENSGITALMLASNRCDTHLVELLLDRGADPNMLDDNDGFTALMWVSQVRTTTPGIVKLLLDNGSDPNIVNQHGETAIMRATDRGHTDIVKLIKDKIALQHALQNLAMTKSMNSLSSPLECLDYDIMKEIMICKREYDHGVHMRMK